MTAVRMSVRLDADVAQRAALAAREDGLSMSAWLAQAATKALVIHEGLRAVREWEAEAGELTRAELAAGQIVIERLRAAREVEPAA